MREKKQMSAREENARSLNKMMEAFIVVTLTASILAYTL